MLSTREAECVIAVAEYRNISKAAEHLHIAQPALSRSLRAIEDRLGVELFDRSTTPLSITYAGSRYLSYAKQYLSLLMRMEEEFSTIAPHKQSTLCFGVPTQIGNYIFPKSVSSFLREHPNIRIDMKGGSTRQLADLLKAGKLQLYSVRRSTVRA